MGLLAEELELSHDAERRAELASMQIKAIALSVEARKHALVEELARGSTRRSA
ncbi:hypothetical protein DB32_005813 [Sandaracinus amylolyticus]|uniref:Uncharacterized protein n=1 Tax=Sandaracinus amylolyticus TaxID=927083 RepID=A0A0F6SGG7_9BACT|nr:hypothetical protein DB32_005813 [Sandaracinus amylolyticus]